MNFKEIIFCVLISLGLAGCGIGGYQMNGVSGRERTEYLKSIKAYGEYWTKPEMSVESWRQDWVACGGMRNGQYSGNAPTGATTQVILISQEQERKRLDACMTSKGYEYHYTK